jgi:hypothetical protein
MKCSMTGQEKCDLLIQVTAWAGSTVLYKNVDNCGYYICFLRYPMY